MSFIQRTKEYAQLPLTVHQMHDRTAFNLLELLRLREEEHVPEDDGMVREDATVDAEERVFGDEDDVAVVEVEFCVVLDRVEGRDTHR